MHKWAGDGLQGGWDSMCKQASTPYTGQLLAHLESLWYALAGLGMWHELLPAHHFLFVDEVVSAQRDLLPTMCLTVVRNIDSFERELSRCEYDAIHLQYCDIRYDAMYHAITMY